LAYLNDSFGLATPTRLITGDTNLALELTLEAPASSSSKAAPLGKVAKPD
jgi:hypothetical protein